MYKDCYNICLEDGCNNNRDVQKSHTKLDENGDPVELECYDYSAEFDDGELNTRIRKCPNFANWGCFVANFTARNLDDWYPELAINQGCSMFDLDQNDECNNLGSVGTACKSQCSGDLCNEVPLSCQGKDIKTFKFSIWILFA